MKETNAVEPHIAVIEPSRKLEAYIPGQPQTQEQFLIQIAVFSDPRGQSVTLSFTTEVQTPSEDSAAQETASFTVSLADAQKLEAALQEAIAMCRKNS